MSTLKIDTLVDVSRELAAQTPNSVDAEYIVEGTAKAWGHWEGSDTTLDDSFNLSSVTDNSAGNYSPQYSITMANGNYMGGSHNGHGQLNGSSDGTRLTVFAVGSCTISTWSNGLVSDQDNNCFNMIGELA